MGLQQATASPLVHRYEGLGVVAEQVFGTAVKQLI